jgi:hypothetical protein
MNDTLPLRIDNALSIVTFNKECQDFGAISPFTLLVEDEISQKLRSSSAAENPSMRH